MSHIYEIEALDHVEDALLIGVEVGRLDVVLIGFLRSIDFKNANLAAVAELLDRIDADDTWLFPLRGSTYIMGELEILRKTLWINLNLADAYNHGAVDDSLSFSFSSGILSIGYKTCHK